MKTEIESFITKCENFKASDESLEPCVFYELLRFLLKNVCSKFDPSKPHPLEPETSLKSYKHFKSLFKSFKELAKEDEVKNEGVLGFISFIEDFLELMVSNLEFDLPVSRESYEQKTKRKKN